MANKIIRTAAAYIKSMRPYSFFVTGTAGILGLLASGHLEDTGRIVIILCLLFSSYGINQVINDLLGSKEDKLNAPFRPLVSGELSREAAIAITLFLFVAGAIVTYFLNHYALIIYLLAYGMNIAYEQLKGIPMIGNIWFGFMIALAPVFGFLASSSANNYDILRNPDLVSLAALVAASSSSLCYYTYFKDYEGDKRSNKNTIIVALGLRRARYLNLPMSLIPFLLFWILIAFNRLNFEFNYISVIFLALAFAFCLYAAIFSFANPGQVSKSLELNFECTPIFLSALMIPLNPAVGIALFISSFVSMKIIYKLMYSKRFY